MPAPRSYADCEVRDGWFLQQDVNAWTALAYVGAAAVLITGVVRGRFPRAIAALGAVTALEGLGSFLFHGSSGDLASGLHDASLVGMLGFIAGWQAGRLVGAAERGGLIGLGVGLAAGAATTSVDAVTNATVGAAMAAVVTAELFAGRRRLPALWNRTLLVLAGLSVACWFAGSRGGLLCDADSWAQPHGLWHVLTSILVVGWVDRAVPG